MIDSFEPIPIAISIDRAARLACEFARRSMDEIVSAEFRSESYLASTSALTTEAYWVFEIAMRDAVSVAQDGRRSYTLVPDSEGGGMYVVFERGRVGRYSDAIWTPELDSMIGRVGTVTQNPGIVEVGGIAHAYRGELLVGANVVIVGSDRGLLIVREVAE